jgi:hypothetical protein
VQLTVAPTARPPALHWNAVPPLILLSEIMIGPLTVTLPVFLTV